MYKHKTVYELPKLDYAYDALEPYIDAKTMEIHHTKHHMAYLTKLLSADGFDPNKSIEENLLDCPLPMVQNQGGGFYNHNLFWKMLCPKGTKTPKHELLTAIEKKWKTLDDFKKEFTNSALGVFGSGWAWLVKDRKTGELELLQKPNQNHPDIDRKKPIIGIDVWEHAYYLKYQNRRPEYVEAFWHVVNWDYAEGVYCHKCCSC